MQIFYKTKTNTSENNNKSLSEIANTLETDKGTADPLTLSWGKQFPEHKCMHYTTTYEQHLLKFKNQNNFKMLEIGICDKRFPYASAYMWTSYFKDIDYYGVDNFWGHSLEEKKLEIDALNQNNINFIYADQGSYEDWNEIQKLFPNNLDCVVEDGSHWPNHMMISLWQARKILKTNGLYFMEDIQNPRKSRGWYKYDNALVGEELIESFFNKKLYSSFLNNEQNSDIQKSYQLIDLVLDPQGINYLAVFKRL